MLLRLSTDVHALLYRFPLVVMYLWRVPLTTRSSFGKWCFYSSHDNVADKFDSV